MEDLGANTRRLSLAVNRPFISQRAYEVGPPEVIDAFLANDPTYARYFGQTAQTAACI